MRETPAIRSREAAVTPGALHIREAKPDTKGWRCGVAAAVMTGAGAPPPTQSRRWHITATLFGRSLFRGAGSPVPATNPEPFGPLPLSAFAEWQRGPGNMSFSTSFDRTTHLFPVEMKHCEAQSPEVAESGCWSQWASSCWRGAAGDSPRWG